MFNQFRNALESVAQQPIRILDAASSPESNGDNTSRSSPDTQAPLSSSQLAESAIRKSFASQRVGPAPDSVKPPSPAPGTRKSTLEERLRRAAQALATNEVAFVGTESSPSSTRGRSDSVASQTMQTSSTATSSSSATRGRPAGVSKPSPNKPSSKIAPAVPSGRNRRVESSRPGSVPPSRSSSPASKPPTRVPSPAPAFRNGSTVQPTASPPPIATTKTPSRPSSRPSSPAPAARTRRTSELATKTTRAASPSPLRRSSIPVNNARLSGPSIAADPDDPMSKSSEDTLPVSTDDKDEEEGEKREFDPSTTGPTEPSIAQSGNNQEADPPNQEKELHTQTLPLLPTQSIPELPDSATDMTTDAVPDVTTDPSVIISGYLQPEHTLKDQSTPRRETSTEANELVDPEELQSMDEDSVADTSAPVDRKGPSEADLPSSDSKATVSPPELVSTISESPKLPTYHQETERPNDISDIDHSAEIESLQARLKEVEQRFSDVSSSFQRLHVEKLAADDILQENSPLESFSNAKALRDYFANLRVKDEVFQGEIKRLTRMLELQDDRLQELHVNHKLETQAHSEELGKMKTHLKETETLFEAAQRGTTNAEEVVDQKKEEISRLKKELEQSKNLAKEEEEKRVKAITLLKTVRQKLVKAEKDREDVSKEMATMREREKGNKDKDQAEKLHLLRDLELSAQEIAALRAQFEKELAATRERYEQEASTLKGEHELDLAGVKTSYNEELASKSSRISTLDISLHNVTRDKNAFFDQLQLRQAELESTQAHADTIQHQNTELEFQLREANDRFALVREEYSELQREMESRSREPTVSAEEIARAVSAIEVKCEVRLAEMKRNISVLEQERHESEVDWSRKLTEKVRELEDLKKMLGSATMMRESEEKVVADVKSELEAAQETNKGLRREVAGLMLLKGQIEELERSLKEQEHGTSIKIRVLEKQIDEHKAREAQLKQGNKSLREELRKVQSSAALLERQRNPGVGHWGTPRPGGSGSGDASNGALTELRVSTPSPSPADSPSNSSLSSAPTKTDEEVNLEYVRNVVLQFLEHKERRPQLVKVLSIILQLTPQETRRLIAKI